MQTTKTCTSCQPGYFLSGSTCLSCYMNCKTCSSADQNACLTCYNGYFLSTGQCISCQNECKVCQADNQCQSCYLPYYLDEFQCVLTCPVNKQLFQSNKVEFKTDTEYSCQNCLGNCLTCVTNSQTLCASCKTNYYFYN